MSSWTWEEVLSKYPRKCAAPVSAFQKEHLAPYWDRMMEGEVVGEIDLSAGLESTNSKKKRLSIAVNNRKRCRNKVIKYWFVQVVQIEGYLLKVRFLGFPSNLQDTVTEQERWISYNQLKKIGYYVDNGGMFTVPILYDDMVPEPKETLVERLKGIAGKRTGNALSMGWLEKKEKEIKWKSPTKVEVRNEDCVTEMLPGRISKSVGRRVKVMYCGSPDFKLKGIWVHGDSDLIQLPGWTKTAGGKMNASVKDYDPAPLQSTKLDDHIQQGASINIEVDMMFELINPIKLDDVAVGQAIEVLRHGYFICKIVSAVNKGDLRKFANGINEFHFHITSDQLFPLGSFACLAADEGETPPPRPLGAEDDEQFTWASYLELNGYKELPIPNKNNTGHGFEENMLIEAVDTNQSEFVCPAKIVKIVDQHAMKVHFLGWGPEFDQWKPIKSLEIFPIGWCQFRDYPLLGRPSSVPVPVLAPDAPTGKTTKSPDSPVSMKKGRGRPRKGQPTGAALVDQKKTGNVNKANPKKPQVTSHRKEEE